jgi:hypothetical protein
MKNVKTFEEYNEKVHKFKVRDYVYVKRNRFTPNWFTNLGKIMDIRYNLGGRYTYEILLSVSETILGDDDSILRKLTEDEIEQYETEISAKKYNL